MKSKILKWTARTIAILIVLVAGNSALAQSWEHRNIIFSGMMNAYSPQTATGTGPYEIRGPWSLTVKPGGTKADFSAALNMEFSDGWVMTTGKMNFDPNARGAHTHHILLIDGDIKVIPNGFQVTGTASFTVNGGPAPKTVAPSPVVIQITGGSDVEFSNMTLTFESPGSGHFGSAPLPGVVQSIKEEHGREQRW